MGQQPVSSLPASCCPAYTANRKPHALHHMLQEQALRFTLLRKVRRRKLTIAAAVRGRAPRRVLQPDDDAAPALHAACPMHGQKAPAVSRTYSRKHCAPACNPMQVACGRFWMSPFWRSRRTSWLLRSMCRHRRSMQPSLMLSLRASTDHPTWSPLAHLQSQA